MKSQNVSVCIIAKNCEDIIPVTLRWAIENFDEVCVVCDPNNDDKTAELLKAYQYFLIKLEYHKFDNFSNQKNRAFDMATTPWVLSVDSDEIFEENIPWDKLVSGMERSGSESASFNLYNLQRDLDHFKGPIEPKIRLMKKEIASMDGKPVDEGLDFAGRKIVAFPYAHIHFGHVRSSEALKLKGKDRIQFKDDDPCDGPGLNQHGEDWFIERNKNWDENVIMCPTFVKKTIKRYWK